MLERSRTKAAVMSEHHAVVDSPCLHSIVRIVLSVHRCVLIEAPGIFVGPSHPGPPRPTHCRLKPWLGHTHWQAGAVPFCGSIQGRHPSVTWSRQLHGWCPKPAQATIYLLRGPGPRESQDLQLSSVQSTGQLFLANLTVARQFRLRRSY